MGFFSKSESKRLMLVLDIGSSSIGGALFWVYESGVPRIIFSIREPILLEETVDIDKFLASTIKSIEVVASKICLAGLGAPDKIHCVLSSSWYASQSRVIKYKKDAPFLFNLKLADSLIEKEISLLQSELAVQYSETDGKVRPIEFKNMKTRLNGYDTPDPINKKVQEVEMTIFLSMSPEGVLRQMEEAIGRHFHTKVKFSSFSMASFSVVRDVFLYQENFLLININGEVTDISMVKKDVLTDSISFPMGRNYMIRGVAAGLGCSLDHAKSMLSLFKDGHANDETEKDLKPVMAQLKSEWLKNLQQALVNISSDISIPSNIFITVDQDLVPYFSDIIKNEQLNQYSLTEWKFKLIFLGIEALHGIATFEENVPRDPFIIFESIYINRFLR